MFIVFSIVIGLFLLYWLIIIVFCLDYFFWILNMLFMYEIIYLVVRSIWENGNVDCVIKGFGGWWVEIVYFVFG